MAASNDSTAPWKSRASNCVQPRRSCCWARCRSGVSVVRGAGVWAASTTTTSRLGIVHMESSSLGVLRNRLQRVRIPRIAVAAVLRTSIIQPELLADLRRALHVGAAFGALVQLLPPAGGRLSRLIGHEVSYLEEIEYLISTPSTNSAVMRW